MAERVQYQIPNYPIIQLPNSCDRRAAAVVGRHAHLDLRFERRAGRTVLAHAYVEPPLRIGRAFDLDGAAYLILACTGPGIFAGDCVRQRIEVGAGARVVLVSQSAVQVHPSDAAQPAAVHHDYQVGTDAELHCHWDPVIPFAGARLVQRFDLRLAASSRLYWSDALMSGRVSRGESWRFASIDHELRLAVDDGLKYMERYGLEPQARRPFRPWIAGDAQYLGTTIVHHEAAVADVAARLHHQLGGIDRVTAGVDLIETRLIVGRVLAAGGAPFATARALFRETSLDVVFGEPRLVARR